MRLLPLIILISVSILALKVISIVFTDAPISIGITEVSAAEGDGTDDEKAAEEKNKKEGEADDFDQILAGQEKKALTQSFTNSEIQLLQSLKKRRAQLDKRARQIDLQAKLLVAAEQQLESKILKLQALEKAIKAKLGEVNTKEANRFANLVKTYETMKPKEAAAILSILDISIMEKITRSMSTKKLAPILAKMDMKAARALTIRLAQPPMEMTVGDIAAPNTGGKKKGLPKLNLE